MMNNIFTPFDLQISSLPSFANLMPIHFYILTLILMNMYWSVTSPTFVPFKITTTVHPLVKSSKGNLLPGMTALISAVFSMIWRQNFGGLLPWAPSTTAHLIFSLSMSIPLWALLPIMSLLQKPPSSNSHYLPEASTMPISPFLAVVEMISSLIRPVTLAFRLSANISAGHVIVSMMSTVFSFTLISTSTSSMFFLLLVGAFYMLFEVMVCAIQSYVFSLLLIMYTNDYLMSQP